MCIPRALHSPLFLSLENEYRLTWFPKSNQWILLDEVDYFFLQLFTKGISQENALLRFKGNTVFTQEELKIRLQNLYQSFDFLLNENPQAETLVPEIPGMPQKDKIPLKVMGYRSAAGYFSISYGSPGLFHYIHNSLKAQSLAQSESFAGYSMKLEAVPLEDKVYLAIDTKDKKEQYHRFDNAPQLKRKLLEVIAGYLYPQTHWMGYLHASAVIKDGHMLLFSSASGSGKSTLAAALVQNGFSFMSDDFIPIDMNHHAFSFPTALSLKDDKENLRGSFKSSWKDIWGNYFVWPYPQKEFWNTAKATTLYFVSFKKGEDFQLKPLAPQEVAQLIFQEMYVLNNEQSARSFMQWFEQCSFYKLTYGNLDEAVLKIKNGIKQEEPK